MQLTAARESACARATRRRASARSSCAAERHPDHDAGVAVPAADVGGARAPAARRDGDRRRDPLAGRQQARRAPVPVARAARGAAPRASRRSSASALGDAAAARRGRAAARRRQREPRGARRRARSTIVDAGAKKPPSRSRCRVEAPARWTSGQDRRALPHERRSIWPAIHPRLRRADPRAPLDADLREQPAPGRAARRGAERARRRGARARAPRLDRARAPRARSRTGSSAASSRRSSRRRRSSSASTWARSIW